MSNFCQAGGAGCEIGEDCLEDGDCLSGNCVGCTCELEGCGDECTEDDTVDLGYDGYETTVPVDGCVMVRDHYPYWWDTRTMVSDHDSRRLSGAVRLEQRVHPYEWLWHLHG